jgi:hypothetical protein
MMFVDRVLQTPVANLTIADSNYKQLVRMQGGVFATLLDLAKATLIAQADPVLSSASGLLDILFGVAFATFVLAGFLLRAAVLEVRNGIRRTRRVLLMLPTDLVARSTAINTYLATGKVEIATMSK